jgi:hypothetical protein
LFIRLRASLFAGLAEGRHIAVVEDFSLAEEKHGGEGGTEDIAHSAGLPQASKTVIAKGGHDGRDDEHKRDKEEHLA